MGEFSKALEFNQAEFIAARLAHVRGLSANRFKSDKFFLARQHAYFLLAYRDCKCLNHGCGGCAITLGVATQLENDIMPLDHVRCDQEEARACTFWTRKWNELQVFLGVVKECHARLKREREGRKAIRTAPIDNDEA